MQPTIKVMIRTLTFLLLVTLIIPAGKLVWADEIVDVTKKGEISVTIRNTATGKGIPGGSLILYKVAGAVQDETGGYVFDASETDFARAEGDYSSEASLNASLAEKLAAFAEKRKITGRTLKLDNNGTARASELEVGLYLLVQKEAAEGYSKISPFLVSIPQRTKDGKLIYKVDATPKPELSRALSPTLSPTPTTWMTDVSSNIRRKTTDTTTTSTSTDHLPQTGQMWWPVFALAGAGIICLLIGFMVRKQM